MHGPKLIPRCRRYVTIGSRIVSRCVDARGTILIVDVTWEVPVQVAAASRDRGISSLGDEIPAVLVDILEEEGDVVPSGIPTTFEKRVLIAIESAYLRVLEIRRIVVVAVDDNRRLFYRPCVIPIGRFSTNGFRESESKETDTSHEREDDADQSNLFSPRSLLFWSSSPACFEQDTRDTTRREITIDIPCVLRARANITQRPSL